MRAPRLWPPLWPALGNVSSLKSHRPIVPGVSTPRPLRRTTTPLWPGRSTAKVLIMLIVPRVADSYFAAIGLCPQTLLIDSQPLFLAALSSLLSAPPVNARVQAVTRSDTALEMLTRLGADLVVCDARAVPHTGPELASTIGERSPTTKVVLLADSEDSEMLLSAVRSGAYGFFTKDCPPDEFLEGIQAVLAGHLVVARRLVYGALTALEGKHLASVERPSNSLSTSERGILIMVSHAQSIASIAIERGITRKTVRNHLSNIYKKLGVRNRTEAILCAARLGLVKADGADRE